MATKSEKVRPIIIKDVKTGDPKYTLEFSRKTVAVAERRGIQHQLFFRVDAVKTEHLLPHTSRFVKEQVAPGCTAFKDLPVIPKGTVEYVCAESASG